MKRMVSKDMVVVAARGQVSSDLGGEVAILDLERGIYYGLDEVGAHIWGLVQEPTAVSDLQATVVEEYDVDPARAERDLLTLLQRLVDEGLVEVQDETSA